MIRTFVNKLRVSRGFTVHSPFAYYFIRRVLQERAHFYCFSELRAKPDRRLFRLVNYFQPSTVCIIGAEGSARAMEVMTMAKRELMLTDSPADADFVYVCAGAQGPLPGGCRALYAAAPGRRAIDRLVADTTEGMTFTNGECVIAVTRPGLPRQHYSLYF